MLESINIEQHDTLIKDKNLTTNKVRNFSNASDSKTFSYSWVDEIWIWADEFNISEEEIPRNQDGLEALTQIIIDTTYPYAGYYANISELPEDYFLTPLYHMKEVPMELTNLEHLEKVYLRNVDASKFIEKLSKLSRFKDIYLYATNIKRLPIDINKLRNLNSLSICESELTELPETICEIDELKDLDIYAEKLGKLPSNLDKLTSLIKLAIRSDNLSEIPSNIFQLSQLKYLHIGGKKYLKYQLILNF